MSDSHGQPFSVRIDLQQGYAFDVDFGIPGTDPLRVDEPAPLGEGAGPNPARLLAAAVANCLAASLLFCLRKSHVEVEGIRAEVEGTIERNDRGRLRIGSLRVKVIPRLGADDMPRLERCESMFEDFCIVTASVREGLTVEVDVVPEAIPAEVAPV